MTDDRRWGRAGVRLTPTEARAKDRAATQRRLEEAIAARRSEADARKAWENGLVCPYRITTALDMRRLYGPQVDEACGVREPAVDMWEEGTLYPTWEQLLALAALTGFPPGFFMLPPDGRITVLRAHEVFICPPPKHEPDARPVYLRCTREAIAAAMRTPQPTYHAEKLF